MKVEELIERLNDFDPDAEIIIDDGTDYGCDIASIDENVDGDEIWIQLTNS